MRLKYLEVIECKANRQLPWFTSELWFQIGCWLFIAGVVVGLLVGSWYNGVLNSLGN